MVNSGPFRPQFCLICKHLAAKVAQNEICDLRPGRKVAVVAKDTLCDPATLRPSRKVAKVAESQKYHSATLRPCDLVARSQVAGDPFCRVATQRLPENSELSLHAQTLLAIIIMSF